MSRNLGVQYGFRRGHTTSFDAANPFLFLHAFKTAGSSVRLQLERTIDARVRCGVTVATDLRGRLKRYVREADVRPGAHFYYGHFFYGLHRQVGEQAVYGTVLRDPTDRAISHFQHFARNGQPDSASVTELLNSREVQLDNLQTRMISGHRGVPFGEIGQAHIDEALANLDAFAFVGDFANLDLSIDRLGNVLGCKLQPAQRVNVHANPVPVKQSEVDRLAELNRADAALYAAAKKRHG